MTYEEYVEEESGGIACAIKAGQVMAYLENTEFLPVTFPDRCVTENLARSLATMLEKRGFADELKWRVFIWLLRKIKA